MIKPSNSKYIDIVNYINNIARLRQLLSITQKEMSDLLRISPSTYSRWERGNFKTTQVSYILIIVKILESKSDYKENSIK
jgi:transcriptional regulator with XRE-family HTH domain